MTPDRRLDQLEPEVAEVLQKTDRLIEGQGQLVDLATKTKADLDQAKATGEITATGLAKLTVTVNDLRAEINQRFDRSDQIQQEILMFLRNRFQ